MQALIALAALAGCAAPRHAPPPSRAAAGPTAEEATPVLPVADPGTSLAAEIQDPSTQLHLHIRGVVEVAQGKPRMAVPASRAMPYVLAWRRLLLDPERGRLACMTADSHAFGCVQTLTRGSGPILLLGICRGDGRDWRLASVTIASAIDDLTGFLGDIYTRDCPR